MHPAPKALRTIVGGVLLARPRATSGLARRVAPPQHARDLTTLSRIHYADAFVVPTGSASDRSGEAWARAMLEGAPTGTREALRRGWASLRLDLGPPDDDRRVLGWEIARQSPDHAVLHAESRLGFAGEVLFVSRPGELLFATLVQFDSLLGRAVWTGVGLSHRRVVASLLEHGMLRERRRAVSAGG